MRQSIPLTDTPALGALLAAEFVNAAADVPAVNVHTHTNQHSMRQHDLENEGIASAQHNPQVTHDTTDSEGVTPETLQTHERSH